MIKDLYSCKLLLAKTDSNLPTQLTASRADNFHKTKVIKSLMGELNCARYELAEQKQHSELLAVENDALVVKLATRLEEPASKVGDVPTSSLPPIEPNRKWQCPTHVVGGGFVFTTPGKHTSSSTPPSVPCQPLPRRDGPIDSCLIQG